MPTEFFFTKIILLKIGQFFRKLQVLLQILACSLYICARIYVYAQGFICF